MEEHLTGEPKNRVLGTSLVAQWISLCAPNAGDLGFNSWSGN